MELVIHTYGHIDAIYYVLNGIAMLMEHIGEPLIKAISLITASYYAMLIAYSGTQGKQYFIKLAGMIIVINSLLVPTTSMSIIDHVSKKREKVDNLPYGFAVPIGFLEEFGYILTMGFEQAFTKVGNANYTDYGMIFGARLVQDSRNWRIKTPEFSENMHYFLKRCVARDAMIGQHYTKNDLFSSNNMWELIYKNLGTLRKVPMRKGNSQDLVGCKEAADNYIIPAFTNEIIKLKNKKKNTDAGQATINEKLLPRAEGVPNNLLNENIKLAFSSQIGTNQSAEDLIKQQMMINSLSNIGDEYGYARASSTQESSWRISGELASTYIPILLTVLKCLIYASFIFMVPML